MASYNVLTRWGGSVSCVERRFCSLLALLGCPDKPNLSLNCFVWLTPNKASESSQRNVPNRGLGKRSWTWLDPLRGEKRGACWPKVRIEWFVENIKADILFQHGFDSLPLWAPDLMWPGTLLLLYFLGYIRTDSSEEVCVLTAWAGWDFTNCPQCGCTISKITNLLCGRWNITTASEQQGSGTTQRNDEAEKAWLISRWSVISSWKRLYDSCLWLQRPTHGYVVRTRAASLLWEA